MPTTEQRIEEGREAERLLGDDALLSRIFRALENEYMEAWGSTPPDAYERRERVYLLLAALRNVRAEIERRIFDGKIALRAADLTEREERLNA